MAGVVAGTAVAVACSAALVDAGRRLGRHLYGREWVAVVLAAATTTTAGVVVILEVLGTAGWLSVWGVLTGSALLWVLALRLSGWERAGARGAVLRREPTALSRPAALAAVGLVALVAVVLVDAVLEPRIQFDALDYHLPIAVHWLQAGNTRLLPYLTPNGHFAAYPANFELLELWLLLPVHRDFLVQLAGVPGLVLAGFGTARLATALGARTRVAGAAGLLGVTLPTVLLTQVGTNLNDLFMAGAVVAAAAFVAGYARDGRPADLVLAGLALGIAVGTKYQGLIAGLPVAALAVPAIATRPSRWVRRAALFAAPVVLTGSYFYVRNAVTVHNPVYPLAWSIPFHRFPAPRLTNCCVGPSWIGFGWHPSVWGRAAWQIFFANPSALEINRSWGPMLGVLLIAGLAVPLLALRHRREGRPLAWWWALLPAAELVVYLATPLSAGYGAVMGAINVRYCLPAVMASAALAAAALGRLPPRRQEQVVAIALSAGLGSTVAMSSALAPRPAIPLAVGLAVGIAGAAAIFVRRPVRPPPLVRAATIGAASCVAVVGLSPLLDSHYQRTRASLPFQLAADHLPPAGRPVDVVGFCETYALYGPHLDRRVLYLTGSDSSDPPLATTYRAWTRQLGAERIASIVVANQPNACFPGPPPPQARWIGQHRGRFRVTFRGPDATVYSYAAGSPPDNRTG